MPTPATFNVENYFTSFADKSAMEEASRFRTIPTGSYLMQVTKYEGIYLELDPRGFWKRVFTEDNTNVDPSWRPGVRYSGVVYNPTDPAKKLRTMYIDASWDNKRDPKTGELDKYFKRWEQLKRAMFPQSKNEEKSVGDVTQALLQYPVSVKVTESFHVEAIDGSKQWKTPTQAEEIKQYREAGYKCENFIQAVSKAS